MSEVVIPVSAAKSPFIHLHVHSMYSLSDAMGDVVDVVARAKELGYDAVALTDHGGLYGAIEFYEAAHKAGIKPILGVEAYIAPNKHTDRRPRIDDQMSHLTLLAETNEGYHHLLKLVSISFLDGFYYKPRMDKDLLRQYGKGLIALSGCLKGEIPKALAQHDPEKADRLVATYQDIFGKESFFLEIIHHPESPTQIEVNEALIALARRTGAPLVATKDTHYLRPDDAEAQDALQCIHDGKMLSDHNRYSMSGTDHSMTPAEDMIAAFSHIPEAITNTRQIADRCNVTLELGKNLLPTFDVPAGKTPDGYLKELCEAGLRERYSQEIPQEAKDRLVFELETIQRMGFAAYFLIVQDYVNWAKDHGVIVGPGRGSAAGSVVAYVLKITNIDPLQYGLLFERFLNPDRISMPDIDLDFDDVRRKDVIEYVTQKYGGDRVAGIITFGTMAARAAIRDVSRVLGWTFQEVDRVAKAVPPPVQGKHIPLKDSIKDNHELRALYEGEPRIKQLIDLAIKLEGTARHASQHACGIVIAPQPLVDFAPLQKAQGGDVAQVIQYSLHSTEASGLLKMDFLGLSNLTVIRESLEIIEAVEGIQVDIEKLPLNDQATFDLLGRGETTGVFQLESDGMKKYIRELHPTLIEDVIAMVALYRPGPLGAGLVESFILRKHGKEKVTYKHPLTENALKNTYGIPVYQEQVMQVSKDMAGFTGGEADTLRKAMGKKNAKLMNEMKAKFIHGSVANGVTSMIAEEIFSQFEEFAAYGFNKSHAACYAMIAYQTAYLKAHWPSCFMAALLNSDSQNLDRITIEVEECRRIHLEVLPPDINESFAGFSVVKGTNKIRFGLQAIKGLGEDVVQVMVAERKDKGEFTSLSEFVTRVPGKAINRKSLECLIRSGALDRFGERNTLFFNIESILEHHRQHQREASSGQFNLFSQTATASGSEMLRLKSVPNASKRELLSWEKELLGLYVSEHPFREYGEKLAHLLTPISRLAEYKKEKKVRVGGVISIAKKILTKNNEPMMFCKLEDGTGDTEAVIFPRVYKEHPEVWFEDRLVIVSGKPSEKDGKMNILVETGFEITPQNIEEIAQSGSLTKSSAQSPDHSAEPFGAPPAERAITLRIRAQLPDTMLIKLRRILDTHPGEQAVYFAIEDTDGIRTVKSTACIHFGELIVKELEDLLGKGTVQIGS